MKKFRNRIITFLALAGLQAPGSLLAALVDTPAAGDLFLGVRATDGQGSGTSYLIKIGNDATFRNATPGISLDLANVGADLTTIFGANWHARADVSWAVFGTRNQTNPVTYASRAHSIFGTSVSGLAAQSLAARSSTNTQLVSLISAYSSLDRTVNSSKAAAQTNAANSGSYNFQVGTGGTTDFGGLSGWTSIEGSFANGAKRAALDLFRYSGNTNTNVNTVERLGSFGITSAGALSFLAGPVLEQVQVQDEAISIAENGGNATIYFQRFGDTLATPSTVTFAVNNGSASVGTDFTLPSPLTVDFIAGQSTASVDVPITNRTGYQGQRSFTVQLVSATDGFTVQSPNTTTVTINEVDPDPGALAFDSATFNASVTDTSVDINLTRTAPTAGAGTVTVDVSVVSGGSLVNGAGYTFTSPTTVTFAGDATTASTTVALSTALQGTITLSLSNPANTTTPANPARLGAQTTATVNVAGNPGVLAFAASSYSFPENAVTINLPIVRTVGLQGQVTVQVDTSSGTASAGTDFIPLSGYVATLDDEASSVPVPIALLVNNPSGGETNETFTVTLSNPSGATLGVITTATVRINEFDSVAPTVALTAPLPNARISPGPTVLVTGSFTDDKGIDRINVRHNGGAAAAATLAGNANLTSGTFSRSITPTAGLNTLTVQAVDGTGNVSTLASRSFTFVVNTPLTVSVSGAGTLTPLLGITLPGTVTNAEIGKSYTITARPAVGKLFAGWTGAGLPGAGVSVTAAELATLSFVHQNGLAITANFITNPFTADVVGDFNGLIQHPTPLSRSLASEGFVTVNVTTAGAFSGTLRIDGGSAPLRGVLNTSGVARFGPARTQTLLIPRAGKSSLVLAFTVDLNPAGTKKLTGTLSEQGRTGTTLLSNINADRASYKTGPALPLGRQGTYTLVLPGQAQTNGLTADDYPQGDGIGSVTVSATGLASFKGNLADGSPFTASALLTKGLGDINKVPFFAQPYGNKGTIAGNVTFDPGQTESDLSSSSVLWFKPVLGGQYYPFGWLEGVTTQLTGAKYAVPVGTSVIPGLPAESPLDGNATLVFSDGGLDALQSKDVNISVANKVTKVPVTNPTYALTIIPTTGDVSGSFDHSDGSRPTFTGKIVRKGTNGGAYGYFLTVAPKVADGTGEAGGLSLNHK